MEPRINLLPNSGVFSLTLVSLAHFMVFNEPLSICIPVSWNHYSLLLATKGIFEQ